MLYEILDPCISFEASEALLRPNDPKTHRGAKYKERSDYIFPPYDPLYPLPPLAILLTILLTASLRPAPRGPTTRIHIANLQLTHLPSARGLPVHSTFTVLRIYVQINYNPTIRRSHPRPSIQTPKPTVTCYNLPSADLQSYNTPPLHII